MSPPETSPVATREIGCFQMLRAPNPEQVEAALAHAHRAARDIARQNGHPLVDARHHPAFVRLLRELQGRLSLGLIAGCVHVESPTLCLWRAWTPDVLLCPTCFALNMADDPIAGTRRDHECDACGEVDLGGLACVAHIGAVLALMFVCRSCQALG
jgi:hypothetical protein